MGAEVAGPHPPSADGYMYVCGEQAGGPGARYECAFEPGPGSMDQPPYEEHMFGEFGKDRHVQVVVGSVGELQFRDDLPVFAANDKRKDETLLLQSVEAPPPHPPPPPPPTSKKSEKKKSDNNGIKKKKTRLVTVNSITVLLYTERFTAQL